MEGQEGEAIGQGRLTAGGVTDEAAAEKRQKVAEAFSFLEVAESCSSLAQAGCALAWIVVSAKDILAAHKSCQFLKKFVNSDEWHRAGISRGALPIREGELHDVRAELESRPLNEVLSDQFVQRWSKNAWMLSCFSVCNWLYGHNGALKQGRWCKAERQVAAAIGANVQRLLGHGFQQVAWDPGMEKDLRSRKVNYRGEEVGTCKKLTLAQLLPALPPKGHGGSINAIDFVPPGLVPFWLGGPVSGTGGPRGRH